MLWSDPAVSGGLVVVREIRFNAIACCPERVFIGRDTSRVEEEASGMARLARRHVGTVLADRGEDVLVEPVAELLRSASVRTCRQTVDVRLGNEVETSLTPPAVVVMAIFTPPPLQCLPDRISLGLSVPEDSLPGGEASKCGSPLCSTTFTGSFPSNSRRFWIPAAVSTRGDCWAGTSAVWGGDWISAWTYPPFSSNRRKYLFVDPVLEFGGLGEIGAADKIR